MGCMTYRSRDRGEGSSWQVVYHSRCNTVAYHTDSATCGGIGRPLKHTDSGAIRGKKVPGGTDSVGIGGNWMPRNTKYHHGFPGSGVARGP